MAVLCFVVFLTNAIASCFYIPYFCFSRNILVGLLTGSLTLLLVFWKTFVLDVHPFNPRIAMSAGYDGKTIVWDVSSHICKSLHSFHKNSMLCFADTPCPPSFSFSLH